MKNITILLAALMLLSFTFLFAQHQPQLLLPIDGAPAVEPEGVYLVWSLPAGSYVIDSFFDVYLDIDPDFPNPIMFTGEITPSRSDFQYSTGVLMKELVYYWKVRYHAFGDYWESTIFNFVTGVNPLITYSTISGTITQGGTLVSGVKVSCPTACAPVQVFTQAAGSSPGSYSFWVRNGNAAAYWVTPTKNWWNTFTPGSYQSNPITVIGNQTANFTMSSLVPNPAILIWPPYYAQNIKPIGESLQWRYVNEAGYTPPTGFEVYLGDNPIPIAIVEFNRDPIYTVDLPPLQSNILIEWRVVPFNLDGPAQEVDPWYFETGDPYPTNQFFPTELYVYPDDGSSQKEAGLVMIWGDPPPGGGYRHNFPVDSFFDVFCDIDLGFPNPPIYSGSGLLNPLNPQQYYCYSPWLNWGTVYVWKIRLTLPTDEVYESPVWHFITSFEPVPHPEPILWSPVNLASNIPPQGVDLQWTYDPWHVDSFFDVFCDIDPSFPNPPVYSGPGNLVRTILEYHMAALLAEQPYNWFVRYSNFVDYWYSKSPIWTFETGIINEIVPGVPEPIIPPPEAA
ncbi:MAG: hypothetical protein R6V77_06850, partial [Candidatus Cloacimonadaceae bacterium]